MKKRSALRTATLTLLTLTLTQSAGAQPADATAEVRAREFAFAQTMADRDFETFLTFISPEAVFFDTDGPLRGKEEIGRVWSAYFEAAEAPFAWRPDVVEVLDSGSLALTSGPVTVDGEQVGRFTSVWRRDSDGVWRVVFDRGS